MSGTALITAGTCLGLQPERIADLIFFNQNFIENNPAPAV